LLLERIDRLEGRVQYLEEKVADRDQLEQEVIRLKQQSIQVQQVAPSTPVAKEGETFALYGTFRPTLEYRDEGDDDNDNADVRDALSRIGVRGSLAISENLKAIAKGEWSVDISDNGDFGRARQAYAGLEGNFGRVAIGKQRPPQYLLVAEYVDIFNHANSPYAYDSVGPFFVDNLTTYEYRAGDFSLLTAAQFNGDSGDDFSDMINLGLGYDRNDLHLAVTYLQSTAPAEDDSTLEGDELTIWALAYADTFFDKLYTALAYQDISRDIDLGEDRDGSTIDLSFAYPITDYYKIKTGYFDYDDDINTNESNSYWGYNLTFEWQPRNDVRLHVEYLERNFDERSDFNSLAVGIRYDFEKAW